jgi:hypothetical protein
MKRQRFHVPLTPEFLRDVASHETRRIGSYGWRPTPQDIAELRASTGDAVAYRTALRSWRRGGFKVRAAKKLAGRSP